MPPINDFPDLSANGGLKEISFADFTPKIDSFKKNISNQPDFFISRESWNTLMNAKNGNGHEVYAFSFLTAKSGKKAYPRIRTYYKDNTGNILSDLSSTAYLDLQVNPSDCCLKFADKKGSKDKKEIEDDIEKWKESHKDIEKYGVMISKSRIEEILSKHTEAKGSTIVLTYDESAKKVGYIFRVNPDYDGEVPIPPPAQ